MAAGAEHECDNWEIRVTTPAPELLEPGAGDTARLSPRGGGAGAEGGEVIDTDECWTINIKSPASLNIDTGSPDQDGFAVDTCATIHSYRECFYLTTETRFFLLKCKSNLYPRHYI